jgi:hypothetical protein
MKLFTIQDLAARWKVCDKTVMRWRRRWPRLLAPVKTSKRSVRWRPSAIERFEKARLHFNRAYEKKRLRLLYRSLLGQLR